MEQREKKPVPEDAKNSLRVGRFGRNQKVLPAGLLGLLYYLYRIVVLGRDFQESSNFIEHNQVSYPQGIRFLIVSFF